jgi:hypothetical protein
VGQTRASGAATFDSKVVGFDFSFLGEIGGGSREISEGRGRKKNEGRAEARPYSKIPECPYEGGAEIGVSDFLDFPASVAHTTTRAISSRAI